MYLGSVYRYISTVRPSDICRNPIQIRSFGQTPISPVQGERVLQGPGHGCSLASPLQASSCVSPAPPPVHPLPSPQASMSRAGPGLGPGHCTEYIVMNICIHVYMYRNDLDEGTASPPDVHCICCSVLKSMRSFAPQAPHTENTRLGSKTHYVFIVCY